MTCVIEGPMVHRHTAAMPLFFFDTLEDGKLITDGDGLAFPGLPIAREEAVRALGEMARDKLRCRDGQQIAISIRDSSPEPVFTASLTLRVQPAPKRGVPIPLPPADQDEDSSD